jgi:hypothetical protein
VVDAAGRLTVRAGVRARTALICAAHSRDGPREKGGGRAGLLVGEHLGIGEARAIVDHGVDALPADAPGAPPAIAVDPMPHPPNLHELFDVGVEQRAGPPPFIPAHRAGRLEPAEPVQPQAALHRDDGREREPVIVRDLEGAPAAPPGPRDLAHAIAREAARRTPGARRPIPELAGSVSPKAGDPFPNRPPRDADGRGDRGRGFPCEHPRHDLVSHRGR